MIRSTFIDLLLCFKVSSASISIIIMTRIQKKLLFEWDQQHRQSAGRKEEEFRFMQNEIVIIDMVEKLERIDLTYLDLVVKLFQHFSGSYAAYR